jgi:hypothetical protein
MANDPVHQDPKDGKWYFYDETWADRYGPYDGEQEAREALKKYADPLDRGPEQKN